MDIFLLHQPIVEIHLFDLERVLSQTRPFFRTSTKRTLTVGYGIREAGRHEGSRDWDVSHEAGETAVSMLLVENILWNLGQAVAAAVWAQTTGQPVEHDGETWLKIDEQSGYARPLTPLVDRAAHLAMPSESDFGHCVFDISSVELGSLKVTARMVLVVLNVAGPATPPAAAAVSSTVGSTLTAISALSTAGTLGWAVLTYKDAEYQRRIDEHAQYFATEAQRNNWRPIQNSLRELGFYNGSEDNIVGPKTEAAVKDFAGSAGLPREILITDPRFLRALAKALLDQPPR